MMVVSHGELSHTEIAVTHTAKYSQSELYDFDAKNAPNAFFGRDSIPVHTGRSHDAPPEVVVT